MKKKKVAYVIEDGFVWFDCFSAHKIKMLKDRNDPEFYDLKDKLYLKDSKNEKYIPICFVDRRNCPHFRRKSKKKVISFGTVSEAESLIHKAVKEAIASLKKLYIQIDHIKYQIDIDFSTTEKSIDIMGNNYKIDVFLVLKNVNNSLKKILCGNTICVEVYNTSEISAKKRKALRMQGLSFFEINVSKLHIPSALKKHNNINDLIEYFTNYFMSHCLFGFVPPIKEVLKWKGNSGYYFDETNNEMIDVAFYHDVDLPQYINFFINSSCGISVNIIGWKDYSITDISEARLRANYLVYNYAKKRINIFNKKNLTLL